MTDRRKDYGPTGCVNSAHGPRVSVPSTFTLLLMIAWIGAFWFVSHSRPIRRT